MEHEMVKVQVTQVIDPYNFHARIGTEEYFNALSLREAQYHSLCESISEHPGSLGLTKDKGPGHYIFAKSQEHGKWVRAQINMIERDFVDVLCIDYNSVEHISPYQIISIGIDGYFDYAHETHLCKLAAVTPIASTWISRAGDFLRELTCGYILDGECIGSDDQGRYILDILAEDELGHITSASELLFREGLARLVKVDRSMEKKKVPDFDLTRLNPKPAMPPQLIEKESPPADHAEENVFKQMMGVDTEMPKWFPSDQTIGDQNYQANVDDRTMQTLGEELRLMSTTGPDIASQDTWNNRHDRSDNGQYGQRGCARTQDQCIQENDSSTEQPPNGKRNKGSPSKQETNNHKPTSDKNDRSEQKNNEQRGRSGGRGRGLQQNNLDNSIYTEQVPDGKRNKGTPIKQETSKKNNKPASDTNQQKPASKQIIQDAQPNSKDGNSRHNDDMYDRGEVQESWDGQPYTEENPSLNNYNSESPKAQREMDRPPRLQGIENQQTKSMGNNSRRTGNLFDRKDAQKSAWDNRPYTPEKGPSNSYAPEDPKKGQNIDKNRERQKDSGKPSYANVKPSVPTDWWEAEDRGQGDGNLSDSWLQSEGRRSEHQSKNESPKKKQVPPAVPAPDGRRKYGPTAVIKSASLQNEYSWQSLRVERKAKEILIGLCDDNLYEIIDDFGGLIYPEQSKLARLPGPKELHLCINMWVRYVIDHQNQTHLIIELIETFSNDKTFPVTINDILVECMKEYVSDTTNVQVQRQRKTFIEFIGHLFVACQGWEYNKDPIIDVVTTSFDKWCEFKEKDLESPAMLRLYVKSLTDLLKVAGPMLEKMWPAKVKEGFDRLQMKTIEPALDKDLRLEIVDLLIQRAADWPAVNGKSKNHSQPMSALQHRDRSTQLYPTDLTECVSRGTMVDLSSTAEMYSVSTQTLPQPQMAPSGGAYQTNSGSSRNPYRQVIEMLEYLELPHLIDVFRDCAIRDSLLDLQFGDLRELLREVGLKAGHIWEIKTYLEGNRQHTPSSQYRRQEHCDSPHYDDYHSYHSNHSQSRSRSRSRSPPRSRSQSRSRSRSSYGDMTDPEVAHYSEENHNEADHYNSTTDYQASSAADKHSNASGDNNSTGAGRRAVFIPPHRFQLLTPSNFTSGHYGADQYGPPPDHFAAGPEHFVPPPDHFTAPADNFTTPSDHYTTPPDHYMTPPDHYNTSIDQYATPTDHYAPPKDHCTSQKDHHNPKKDHFTSSKDHFACPKDQSTTPRDHFASSKDHFGTQRDHFNSPKDNYTNSKDNFASSKDQFAFPKDHFASSKDHYTISKDHYTIPKDQYPPSKDHYATPTDFDTVSGSSDVLPPHMSAAINMELEAPLPPFQPAYMNNNGSHSSGSQNSAHQPIPTSPMQKTKFSRADTDRNWRRPRPHP